MNNKCPCGNCICVAICSGKDFDNLIRGCNLVHNYYYYGTTLKFDDRLKNIVDILNPPWRKRLFNI